jgi:hypothetical protein
MQTMTQRSEAHPIDHNIEPVVPGDIGYVHGPETTMYTGLAVIPAPDAVEDVTPMYTGPAVPAPEEAQQSKYVLKLHARKKADGGYEFSPAPFAANHTGERAEVVEEAAQAVPAAQRVTPKPRIIAKIKPEAAVHSNGSRQPEAAATPEAREKNIPTFKVGVFEPVADTYRRAVIDINYGDAEQPAPFDLSDIKGLETFGHREAILVDDKKDEYLLTPYVDVDNSDQPVAGEVLVDVTRSREQDEVVGVFFSEDGKLPVIDPNEGLSLGNAIKINTGEITNLIATVNTIDKDGVAISRNGGEGVPELGPDRIYALQKEFGLPMKRVQANNAPEAASVAEAEDVVDEPIEEDGGEPALGFKARVQAAMANAAVALDTLRSRARNLDIRESARNGKDRVAVAILNAQMTKPKEYFTDEESGKRRRITGAVLGALALGTVAYLTTKGFTDGGHAANGPHNINDAFSVDAPKGHHAHSLKDAFSVDAPAKHAAKAHEHVQHAQHHTGHHHASHSHQHAANHQPKHVTVNTTLWQAEQAKLGLGHVHHLTQAQIHSIWEHTDHALRMNHMSWDDARHLTKGTKLKG